MARGPARTGMDTTKRMKIEEKIKKKKIVVEVNGREEYHGPHLESGWRQRKRRGKSLK